MAGLPWSYDSNGYLGADQINAGLTALSNIQGFNPDGANTTFVLLYYKTPVPVVGSVPDYAIEVPPLASFSYSPDPNFQFPVLVNPGLRFVCSSTGDVLTATARTVLVQATGRNLT